MKSTEYNDDGIICEHCCRAAVDDIGITQGMYNKWCFESKEFTEDADLEFNDGTDTCTMVSG